MEGSREKIEVRKRGSEIGEGREVKRVRKGSIEWGKEVRREGG